ncbi:WD40 repeat-like protein [Exidia glandulosa HHB12029]|uniref:WD40 repeat-like protein n=1 Tax=Exidia glandulosa HHB12029 TaxID=1314781 RepID=A0A165PWT0_EXIGL|nr:WD40 repeat-like protein [Exidia glandulosa HHB12029]
MPAPRGRAQNLVLAADEVNCLIYAYLLDSGFEHAAFNLRAEARLDASPHAKTHVERGMLIEMLAKALLYTEVEAHWREGAMVSNCRNNFSLMRKHVCAYGKHSHPITVPFPDAMMFNGAMNGNKRKAGVLGRDDHFGKRMRTMDPDSMDPEDAEVISYGFCRIAVSPHLSQYYRALVSNGTNGRRQPRTRDGMGWPIEQLPAARVLPGNNAEVLLCAWSGADALSLATGSKDSSVRLWDLTPTPDPAEFGSALVLWDAPEGPSGDGEREINCLEWSPDGKMLAGGSYDMHMRVWNKDGTLYMNVRAHEAPVYACKFSPSGKHILTIALDGSSRVWDVETKALLKDFTFHSGCCLNADWLNDDIFISCGSDSLILVVSLHAAVPLRTLTGHKGEVNQLALTADRGMAASCGDDAKAIVWDLAPLRNLPTDVLPIGYSETSVTLGEGENAREVYNPAVHGTAQVSTLRGHDSTIAQVVWAPLAAGQTAQKIAATCSFDCTARIWDVTTGTCLHVIAGHLAKCYAACFSPDGRYVVTGAGDASLFVTSVKVSFSSVYRRFSLV